MTTRAGRVHQKADMTFLYHVRYYSCFFRDLDVPISGLFSYSSCNYRVFGHLRGSVAQDGVNHPRDLVTKVAQVPKGLVTRGVQSPKGSGHPGGSGTQGVSYSRGPVTKAVHVPKRLNHPRDQPPKRFGNPRGSVPKGSATREVR